MHNGDSLKKIGVIGAGKMGLCHLAIARMTPRIEVVAFSDRSRWLTKVLSKNIGIPGYTDYRKMISKEALDGVIASVPNLLHGEVALYCLNRGLHLFIEKPLTLDPQTSKAIATIAETQELVNQVGYVNRANPVFAHARKLIRSGVIGEVQTYYSEMVGGVVLKPTTGGWRNDYSKGGGCLYDYGPHCIDLAVYLFGSDATVTGASVKSIHSSHVDDMVTAIFRHDNGTVGRIYVNWSDPTQRKANNQVSVQGSAGKLCFSKQELTLHLNEARPDMNLPSGWSQHFITDQSTEVDFYLRGEDFSRQMVGFAKQIDGEPSIDFSNFREASKVDGLISEIFAAAGIDF